MWGRKGPTFQVRMHVLYIFMSRFTVVSDSLREKVIEACTILFARYVWNAMYHFLLVYAGLKSMKSYIRQTSECTKRKLKNKTSGLCKLPQAHEKCVMKMKER